MKTLTFNSEKETAAKVVEMERRGVKFTVTGRTTIVLPNEK